MLELQILDPLYLGISRSSDLRYFWRVFCEGLFQETKKITNKNYWLAKYLAVVFFKTDFVWVFSTLLGQQP